VELVPGERAVLRQVRDLFLEASVRTYRLNMLTSRWPATHYEAYERGYVGLVKRGFISASAANGLFSITNAGMKAMATA
jgi:hypothetical protein